MENKVKGTNIPNQKPVHGTLENGKQVWKQKIDLLWKKRPIPEFDPVYNQAFINGYSRAFADLIEQLIKDGLYPVKDKKEEE